MIPSVAERLKDWIEAAEKVWEDLPIHAFSEAKFGHIRIDLIRAAVAELEAGAELAVKAESWKEQLFSWQATKERDEFLAALANYKQVTE